MLFNVYFPNGGRGDERVDYKLRYYAGSLRCQVLLLAEIALRAAFRVRCLELLARGRNVIVVGDVNTAHKPEDIWNPEASLCSDC